MPHLRPILSRLHPFKNHQGDRQRASKGVAVTQHESEEKETHFLDDFCIIHLSQTGMHSKEGYWKLTSPPYCKHQGLSQWGLPFSISERCTVSKFKTQCYGGWGGTYISSGTALQTHSESRGESQAVSQSCLTPKSCHCPALVRASPPFPTADEALYCCIRGGRKAFFTHFSFRFLFLNSDLILPQRFANNQSERKLNTELRASMTHHNPSSGSLWNIYYLIYSGQIKSLGGFKLFILIGIGYLPFLCI